MEDVTEHWLPIAGYEGSYEVSDRGRVRSLDRITPRGRRWRGKILSPIPQHRGHLVVNLHGGEDANKHGWTPRFVHHLVLEAFVGARPNDKPVCRHLNGDSADNRAENLVWGTHVENGRDTVEHGAHWQTRKTACPSGHEYSPENTYLNGGRRYCRECQRRNIKAWRERNKCGVA